MQENDDTKARIVFDLASKIAKISIRNFVIQEIINGLSIPILSNEPTEPEILVYPNPTLNELNLSGISDFKTLQIQDINGRNLYSINLNGENEKRVNISEIQTRQLMIILSKEGRKISKKVFKY
jgi:hypothetical protein